MEEYGRKDKTKKEIEFQDLHNRADNLYYIAGDFKKILDLDGPYEAEFFLANLKDLGYDFTALDHELQERKSYDASRTTNKNSRAEFDRKFDELEQAISEEKKKYGLNGEKASS